MPKNYVRPFLLSLLLFALCSTLSAAAPQNDDDIESFLQNIGEAVYGFAWPTATYQGPARVRAGCPRFRAPHSPVQAGEITRSASQSPEAPSPR